MTPEKAKALLASLAPFGMRFGLERMHAMLDALGHPERKFQVLHVAGTNGKGSTCAFAAEILARAGKRVGLYTSPHLVRVNERIQVGGREIGDEAFAAALEAVLAACPWAMEPADPVTYFELNTAMALWHFAQAQVDVAVLETGLGGRLDATNAVRPQVTAISRIAFDHTTILGGTLGAIAAEKGGIFKPDAKVVLGRQPAEALVVLRAMANAVGQPPQIAGQDFALEGEGPFTFTSPDRAIANLRLGLLGPHQRFNAELAVTAALAMPVEVSDANVAHGLAHAQWPGRFEIVAQDPLTILDGAHNPDGAAALAEAMRRLYPNRALHLVLGALADKDVRGIAASLVPLAHAVYLASPKNSRAMATADLETLVGSFGKPSAAYASVEEAVRAARTAGQAPGAVVLVAGSLYVVGEARASLVPTPPGG